MLSFFLYVKLFLFIQRDDSNSLSALEIPSRYRLDHFQNCCCAAALAHAREKRAASCRTVSIATDEALVGGSVGPLEAHEDTRAASATPLAQLAAAPPRMYALCL